MASSAREADRVPAPIGVGAFQFHGPHLSHATRRSRGLIGASAELGASARGRLVRETLRDLLLIATVSPGIGARSYAGQFSWIG